MRFATLTSKGQITIPIDIRLSLGLKEGDRLAFVNQGGEIVIRLDRGKKNPFNEFAGSLPAFSEDVTTINAWVADLRDDA